MTSDEFFEINKSSFDIIFVDGLHHADQVLKDIETSLNVLNEGGYIVCHDMNPKEEEHQRIPFSGGIWNGDCWKAFVELRRTRTDLEMCVVDIDHGCGIIKKGSQKPLEIESEELTYENFDRNRSIWLNLIGWEKFKKANVNRRDYLNDLIKVFVQNPDDAVANYNLGMYYESIGHTASALSYFLRCAERSKTPEISYECLLRGSSCFERQGKRNLTVRGLLQHAVSMMPKRPEAYYLLSRFYEKEANWQDSYMIASIGENVCEEKPVSLHNPVDYPGAYAINFQKGVAAWWCGLAQESKEIFLRLLHDEKNIEMRFVNPSVSNLQMMKSKPFVNFKDEDVEGLKMKFNGCYKIKENSSEAFQDIFVLSLLDGKFGGTYLEIGSGDPEYGNNTLLLEKSFGWTGVAIDADQKYSDSYNLKRKNKCFCRDARHIDYAGFLKDLSFPKEIDYLQLDCDPPEVTYEILLALPLKEYKFAVITYEHDAYCDDTNSFQEKSADYLAKCGYKRIVANVAPDNHRNYEDWWVHPDLVDESRFEVFANRDMSTISGRDVVMRGAI
jgi:SAM-dependent methyltransferase